MEFFDALYVIDGAPQEDTPRHLLMGETSSFVGESAFSDVAGERAPVAGEPADEGLVLSDETVDPHLTAWEYNERDIPVYLEKVAAYPYPFSLRYPASSARLALASALTDTLWYEGHFTFDQLRLQLEWRWDEKALGALAAFYQACEALGEYLESLRLDVDALEHHSAPVCDLIPHITIPSAANAAQPANPAQPASEIPARKVPARMLPQEDTWLLYLPLDPCAFALGGSLLSKICGNAGDGPVEVGDGDYLMDVYEIVREMVEDDIVLSAVTVARGGLMTALSEWCGAGADLDIAPLMKAYDLSETDETDRARVLFGEVPAVLLQIRDEDYDYVDAQCLLQDVAYYALGHPVVSAAGDAHPRINISHNPVPVLSSLLQALISR
ncbi:MAG: hypothetical protein K5651_03645 [Bacteroidales bacterium]|nr:hypothetical protein [Bacteroidales bacterium]